VEGSLGDHETVLLLRKSLNEWNLEHHLDGAKEHIKQFWTQKGRRSWVENGSGLTKYISDVEDNIKDFRKILEEFSKK
jgi:hypothetical protein